MVITLISVLNHPAMSLIDGFFFKNHYNYLSNAMNDTYALPLGSETALIHILAESRNSRNSDLSYNVPELLIKPWKSLQNQTFSLWRNFVIFLYWCLYQDNEFLGLKFQNSRCFRCNTGIMKHSSVRGRSVDRFYQNNNIILSKETTVKTLAPRNQSKRTPPEHSSSLPPIRLSRRWKIKLAPAAWLIIEVPSGPFAVVAKCPYLPSCTGTCPAVTQHDFKCGLEYTQIHKPFDSPPKRFFVCVSWSTYRDRLQHLWSARTNNRFFWLCNVSHVKCIELLQRSF